MDRIPDRTAPLYPEVVGRNEDLELRRAVASFLAGYRGLTRQGHERELTLWGRWCNQYSLHVLHDVQRAHIELYARELEDIRGRKRSTVAHKMSVLAGFYKYCCEEDIIPKNPAANARRPKVEYITTRLHLDDGELRRFLATVTASGRLRDAAICKLLACNGLRISEALNANVEDLGYEGHHRTLRIMRKGGKERVIPLAPFVASAVHAYIGDRTSGPIFLGAEGGRMNRHAAARIVRRHCKKAGITKNISPHCLRHSAITTLLNTGMPLRDVQNFADHSDPRTTSYYDHGRKSLDSNPTYVLASFVSGG